MLTKSLHTITSATRVAAFLLGRESVITSATRVSLTVDALHILGYDYNPRDLTDNVLGVDPTVTRIFEAVAKMVAAEDKARRANPAHCSDIADKTGRAARCPS